MLRVFSKYIVIPVILWWLSVLAVIFFLPPSVAFDSTNIHRAYAIATLTILIAWVGWHLSRWIYKQKQHLLAYILVNSFSGLLLAGVIGAAAFVIDIRASTIFSVQFGLVGVFIGVSWFIMSLVQYPNTHRTERGLFWFGLRGLRLVDKRTSQERQIAQNKRTSQMRPAVPPPPSANLPPPKTTPLGTPLQPPHQNPFQQWPAHSPPVPASESRPSIFVEGDTIPLRPVSPDHAFRTKLPRQRNTATSAPTTPSAAQASRQSTQPATPQMTLPASLQKSQTTVSHDVLPSMEEADAAIEASPVGTIGAEFVAWARHLANRTRAKSEPVSFTQPYPSYSTMNVAQLNWYFYWRTQLRRGNWLPTELSYLLLYSYEIINLIGFKSVMDAYEQFIAFWRHYRVLQPQLDRQLVDWIADFIVVQRLPTTPLDWYGQAIREGAHLGDPDLALEAILRTVPEVGALPLTILFQLANYYPASSKFFQEYNKKGYVEQAYRKGLSVIENYVRGQQGKSLLDLYRLPDYRLIKREPFIGAWHEYSREPILIAEVSHHIGSEDMAASLGGILKYTENILRTREGFKTKLRGFTMQAEWAAILDRAFALPLPGRSLTIDTGKLAALQADSEDVRRKLLAEELAEAGTQATVPTPPAISLETAPSQALPASTPAADLGMTLQVPARPADTPTGLLTDLTGVAQVVGLGDNTVRRLLKALRDNEWEAGKATLTSVVQGEFINVIIDKINETSLRMLGDNLLFEDEDRLVVAEDFRDELGFLLAHAPLTAVHTVRPAPPPMALPDPAEEATYSMLSEPWACFARSLKKYHWQALPILLQNNKVMSQLDALALTYLKTGNQLVDELNESAIDCLGDIIIDTSGPSPLIEEEDSRDLQELLTWAKAKAIID